MEDHQKLYEEINVEVDKQINKIKDLLNEYSVLNDSTLEAFFKNTASIVNISSEFIVEDICKYYSKKFLNSPICEKIEIKNQFYEAKISNKVYRKYKEPDILLFTYDIDLRKINQIYATLVITAGTATLGGIIKYILQNKIDIPIWAILVGSLIAGGVTFFTVVPAINKSRQERAIDEFFVELKAAWLDWLKEVEAYYLQEVENFKANLNLQEV